MFQSEKRLRLFGIGILFLALSFILSNDIISNVLGTTNNTVLSENETGLLYKSDRYTGMKTVGLIFKKFMLQTPAKYVLRTWGLIFKIKVIQFP